VSVNSIWCQNKISKLPAPESFNFTQPNAWPDWKERFLRFSIATKLSRETGEVQVFTLLYCMGKEAEKIFKTLTFEEEAHKSRFGKVIEQFDAYFLP
jgi:hypothetical protein